MVDKYKKKKISLAMYTTKTTPCSYKKREVLYPQQIIDGKGLFGKSI